MHLWKYYKEKICTISLFIFVGSKFTLFVTHCLFYLSLFYSKVSCYYIDPFSCEFSFLFFHHLSSFCTLQKHFLSIFKSEYFVFVHFFFTQQSRICSIFYYKCRNMDEVTCGFRQLVHVYNERVFECYGSGSWARFAVGIPNS